ncbi:MAG: 30S ribosomal protein S9 [Ignavibacteriaceae bacterium]|nr:30S ribosomal protein S9 [Ignavibacteriaceae bacterium]
MNDKIYIGRRKTSVARISLKSGNGKIEVNGKDYVAYFGEGVNAEDILTPMKLTDNEGKFDIVVNVSGGGTTGQAQATRLAISRAIIDMDPELKPKLKVEGLLTRDPRMVERKKYGRPKARKRFQFSKR